MNEVVRLQQDHLMTFQHMEAVNQRMESAEVRQKQMVSFLGKVLQNPAFLSNLREQKERREIASMRVKRKYLKHQPSMSRQDTSTEKLQSADYQQNLTETGTSSGLKETECRVDTQLGTDVLQDMAEELGLDTPGKQILGSSDGSETERMGLLSLESSSSALKDLVSFPTDDSFCDTGYLVSFPDDSSAGEALECAEHPETKEAFNNLQVDTALTSTEYPRWFPGDISQEVVLPEDVNPEMARMDELWNFLGYEVEGRDPSSEGGAWEGGVPYGAQELDIAVPSDSILDLGLQSMDELLEIDTLGTE